MVSQSKSVDSPRSSDCHAKVLLHSKVKCHFILRRLLFWNKLLQTLAHFQEFKWSAGKSTHFFLISAQASSDNLSITFNWSVRSPPSTSLRNYEVWLQLLWEAINSTDNSSPILFFFPFCILKKKNKKNQQQHNKASTTHSMQGNFRLKISSYHLLQQDRQR